MLGIGHTFAVDDCSADDGKTRSVLEAYLRDGLVSLYTPEEVARDGCSRWEREHGAGGNSGGIGWMEWVLGMGRINQALEAERQAACTYACGAVHAPDEGRLFSFLFAQATAPGAAHRCEWLVAFDVDEVMTIQTDLHPSEDLASLLDDANTTGGLPLLRLPWVTMGSGGLETRPPGLMVDNFRAGSFAPFFVKTIARPEFVRDWNFSHWPVMADVSALDAEQGGYGFRIPRPYNSLRAYAERNDLGPEESRQVTVPIAAADNDDDENEYDCPAPAAPLFLKHYAFRSFEEWTAHRAHAALKSDGHLNTHALHTRAKWLEGGDYERYDDHPCAHVYANDFTAAMADRTRESLAARRVRWEEEGRGALFPQIEEWVI